MINGTLLSVSLTLISSSVNKLSAGSRLLPSIIRSGGGASMNFPSRRKNARASAPSATTTRLL